MPILFLFEKYLKVKIEFFLPVNSFLIDKIHAHYIQKNFVDISEKILSMFRTIMSKQIWQYRGRI